MPADADHVLPGVVVTKLGRSRQAVDQLLMRTFQFLRTFPHPTFQVVLVRLHQQRIAYPGDQFLRVDGFGQEIRRSQMQGLLFQFAAFRTRQDQHGQMLELAVRSNRGQNVQAADLRHHDVEQHDVRPVGLHEFQRLRRIGGGDEVAETGIGQLRSHHLDVDRHVVHDHDPGVPGAVVCRARWRRSRGTPDPGEGALRSREGRGAGEG